MEEKQAWRTSVHQTITQLTLGYGHMYLVDDQYLPTNPLLRRAQWNKRPATETAVAHLYKKIGKDLEPLSENHSIWIGVQPSSITSHLSNNAANAQSIDWTPNSTAILVNGNHRFEMIANHILKKELSNVKKLREKEKGMKQASKLANLQAKIREEEMRIFAKSKWLVRVIDLGKFFFAS